MSTNLKVKVVCKSLNLKNEEIITFEVHCSSVANLILFKDTSVVCEYNSCLLKQDKVKTIFTLTDWESFYQENIKMLEDYTLVSELLHTMQEQNYSAAPTQLDVGMWHLPYVFQEFTAKGSQVFLDNSAKELSKKDAISLSVKICKDVLDGPKPHMSPTEHQAKVPPKYADFRTTGITHMDRSGNAWSGNLKNFVQYRQLLQK